MLLDVLLFKLRLYYSKAKRENKRDIGIDKSILPISGLGARFLLLFVFFLSELILLGQISK